jgi:hypothetical protein
MLAQYTKRDLTYDSDALNAIVGALNTLNDGRSPVHHIWGLPFGPKMEPPFAKHFATRRVNIGIFWVHFSPCHRRVGFPSWSPLGWKSNAEFLYRHCEMEVPGDTVLEIWRDKAYSPLHTLMWEDVNLQNLSSKNESQVLKVSALTVPFTKRLIALDDDSQEKKWYIQIHVDQATDVFMLPHWDIINGDAPETRLGICVFIPSIEGARLMVLDESGADYERSGVVDIDRRYSYKEVYGTGAEAFVRNADGDSPILSLADFEDLIVPALSKLAKKHTFLLR